jgi:hypothetical protein
MAFWREFCHAVIDSREQQAIPPDLFDHARSIAIEGVTVRWRFSVLFFAHFDFCSNIANSFSRPCYLVLMQTPKAPDLCDRGSVFARQKGGTKNAFLSKVNLWLCYICSTKHKIPKYCSNPVPVAIGGFDGGLFGGSALLGLKSLTHPPSWVWDRSVFGLFL